MNNYQIIFIIIKNSLLFSFSSMLIFLLAIVTQQIWGDISLGFKFTFTWFRDMCFALYILVILGHSLKIATQIIWPSWNQTVFSSSVVVFQHDMFAARSSSLRYGDSPLWLFWKCVYEPKPFLCSVNLPGNHLSSILLLSHLSAIKIIKSKHVSHDYWEDNVKYASLVLNLLFSFFK